MLFLGPNTDSPAADVWTASANVPCDVHQVLGALTKPDSIARWAPVSFELDDPAAGRLRAGSRQRVSGSIAGVRATFEVDVKRADTQGLELVAHGPVSLDVDYGFRQHSDGVLVDARVGVRRQRGLTAQLVRAAVRAVLNGGALGTALSRLERSLSVPLGSELQAA